MTVRTPPASPLRICLLAHLVALLGLGPGVGYALPEGGQVAAGEVAFDFQGGQLTLDQATAFAAVNWEGFSIAAGEAVRINQPGVDAAILNRVTGADPSQLFGQLSANGRVYVINPNGVLIGPGARIDTQHFLASALDVADADFLAGGDLRLAGDSDAPVVNLGEITAANGDIVLVAQVVRNAGTLAAPEGVVALAAGREVLYQPDADQRIVIAADLAASAVADTGVENNGLIEAAQAELKAAGGNVYDLAINQSGVVRATGVARRDGRVLLTAEAGAIHFDGEISAHDADGSGGEVLIGGDYRGQNEAVVNAARTTVTADSVIDVAARAEHADGGRAIVWADDRTDFAGKIEGQGGALSGDGAFAEVSGKQLLNYRGLADLTAAGGATGTLLLDPENVIISIAADNTPDGAFNNTILANNLATADVTVNASGYGSADSGGYVIVDAPVSWTSGTTLTLQAETGVEVNADLTATGGNLVFLATGSGDGLFGGGGAVMVDSAATITADSLAFGPNPAATFPGQNGPLPEWLTLNGIIIEGALDVGTLDFRLTNAGISGGIIIDNPANRIGSLITSVTNGTLGGDGNFHVVDGDGDLTLDGDFSAGDHSFDRDVTIVTPGDLTLAAGTRISTGNTQGTIVLASTGGSFVNHAGAAALTVGSDASSRYLIYSDDPANTTKGGLTALPVYDKTHATDAPGTITQTGNRFLYSLAPTLTFTANSFSRSEGMDNPGLAYTVSGLVGDDAAAQVYSGVPSLDTPASAGSAAGDYDITIGPGGVTLSDFGYAVQFVNGTLTVDPNKILIVTADDLARAYGDDNPAFTASYAGFLSGDDATLFDGFAITFSTEATAQSPIGTYTITPAGAATLNDYDVTYRPGTLTVNPRLLTITADNKAIVYRADDPTYTATWSGLASFDDESDVPGLSFTVSGTSRDVGDYTITPSGAANANYAITFETGTLTVNPRPLTATVRDTSKTYGEANPSFFVSISGMPFGTSADTTGLVFATTATTGSDRGIYAVTASGMTNPNYDVTYVAGTLTIASYALTISAHDFTREYGDPNPTFTTSATGLTNGDTLADVISGLTVETAATLGTGVGTYSLTPTGTVLNDNYAVTFDPGRLTITKAPISLIALGQTHRTYGDPNPHPRNYDVNIVGLKNGDSLANNAIHVFANTTANPFSSVGTYPVGFLSVSSDNYSIHPSVLVPGTLVIDPRPLTITAASFTREYGDANPELTASYAGLASFDSVAALTGLTFNAPTAAAPAGSYTGGVTASGVINANYDVTYVAADAVITPAPLTVYTQNHRRAFGDSNPLYTADIVDGLKLGQDASILGVSIAPDATVFSDVGVYGLTTTLATGNYTVVATQGSLAITPRPIDVTLAPVTRVYGDANPTVFDFAVSGLVGTDTAASVVSAETDAQPFSPVGLYDLSPVLLSTNYMLNAASDGTDLLRITPRPIDVTVTGDVSRSYRAANGDLSDLVSVNNAVDPIENIIRIEGPDTTADAGIHGVAATLLNGNYSLRSLINDAIFRITPLNIVANLTGEFSRIYGEAEPDFFAGVTPLSTLYDSVENIFGLSGVAATTGVGTHAVGLRSINPNYVVDPVGSLSDATLTITPRPISVSFDHYSRYWGTAPGHEFTATIGGMGLVNGDTLAEAVALQEGTVLSSTAAPGWYARIWALTREGANYEVDYAASAPGYLTVVPNLLVVDIANPRYRDDRIIDLAAVGADNAALAQALQFDIDWYAGSVAGIHQLPAGIAPLPTAPVTAEARGIMAAAVLRVAGSYGRPTLNDVPELYRVTNVPPVAGATRVLDSAVFAQTPDFEVGDDGNPGRMALVFDEAWYDNVAAPSAVVKDYDYTTLEPNTRFASLGAYPDPADAFGVQLRTVVFAYDELPVPIPNIIEGGGDDVEVVTIDDIDSAVSDGTSIIDKQAIEEVSKSEEEKEEERRRADDLDIAKAPSYYAEDFARFQEAFTDTFLQIVELGLEDDQARRGLYDSLWPDGRVTFSTGESATMRAMPNLLAMLRPVPPLAADATQAEREAHAAGEARRDNLIWSLGRAIGLQVSAIAEKENPTAGEVMLRRIMDTAAEQKADEIRQANADAFAAWEEGKRRWTESKDTGTAFTLFDGHIEYEVPPPTPRPIPALEVLVTMAAHDLLSGGGV